MAEEAKTNTKQTRNKQKSCYRPECGQIMVHLGPEVCAFSSLGLLELHISTLSEVKGQPLRLIQCTTCTTVCDSPRKECSLKSKKKFY